MATDKNVSLALGAGGARGFAHIGVIRELQDRGYSISSVAGTSMGALVGGAFAAGKLDDFSDWATSLNKRDVVMLLDPKASGPGAIAAEKLFNTLKELIGDRNIEDLEIPYTAVATDIINQREVWFQSGDLFTAMRSSISIPGVFTPVAVNGRILVDGGLMNPIPVEFTARSQSSKSIAVSLHGKRALPDYTDDKEPGAWRQWLTNTIGDLRDAGDDAGDAINEAGHEFESPKVDSGDAEVPGAQEITQDFVDTLKISDITALSTDAAQTLVARFRLAAYPPDITVTVPVDSCRTLEFYRAQEMIDLGRKLAVQSFDKAELK
ncbi:MAG: patatin-like phospholipase family protein [Candidatus Nanopelagicales bacterium]